MSSKSVTKSKAVGVSEPTEFRSLAEYPAYAVELEKLHDLQRRESSLSKQWTEIARRLQNGSMLNEQIDGDALKILKGETLEPTPSEVEMVRRKFAAVKEAVVLQQDVVKSVQKACQREELQVRKGAYFSIAVKLRDALAMVSEVLAAEVAFRDELERDEFIFTTPLFPLAHEKLQFFAAYHQAEITNQLRQQSSEPSRN